MYEIVKSWLKILKCENPIQMLNQLITDNEVNKLSEMRSIARILPTTIHKNSNESIAVRLRKFLNIIVNYHNNFLDHNKFLEIITIIFLQRIFLNYSFSDCYSLDNEDPLRNTCY